MIGPASHIDLNTKEMGSVRVIKHNIRGNASQLVYILNIILLYSHFHPMNIVSITITDINDIVKQRKMKYL